MFTSSVKREIRHVYVVVVQKWAEKCTKSMVYVQSCCFANKTYCFFEVLVTVRVVGSVPIVYRQTCKFHLSCYPQRDGIIESLQPFQHMSSSRWDERY